MLRHGAGGLLGRVRAGWTFPLETLCINVGGCLAIGLLAGLSEAPGLFAGAAVLRGIEGFGAHSRLHTAKILRLSEDLPFHRRDRRQRGEDRGVPADRRPRDRRGLATVEKVGVRFYRSGESKSG